MRDVLPERVLEPRSHPRFSALACSAAEAEEELQTAARAQGRNANALLDLVQQNEQILVEMKVSA